MVCLLSRLEPPVQGKGILPALAWSSEAEAPLPLRGAERLMMKPGSLERSPRALLAGLHPPISQGQSQDSRGGRDLLRTLLLTLCRALP